MTHSALYLDMRHDLFRLCTFCASCALIANFLPRAARLNRWPRLKWWYELLIDLVAGFGLSWRADRPSLQQEWMGFRAKRKPRVLFLKIEAHPDEEISDGV